MAGLPKLASSISSSSTFGDPAGGWTWPIKPQSGSDPASVLLPTPLNGGPRIGSFVRSGSLILTPASRPLPVGAAAGQEPNGNMTTSTVRIARRFPDDITRRG